MTIKELLKKLNITQNPSYDDNAAVINLSGSDEYARVYSSLENLEEIEIIPEDTVMDTDDVKLSYQTTGLKEDNSPDYSITLSGDLDNNVYQLKIEEK